MFNDNKFDAVPVNALIKSVQSAALKYLDPKQRRKIRSTKAAVKQMSEMYCMQQSLQNKLKKLDRKLCTFFPIGSQVQYNTVDVLKVITMSGKVVAHDLIKNLAHVAFENEPNITVAVHPMKLKLSFIKMSFY